MKRRLTAVGVALLLATGLMTGSSVGAETGDLELDYLEGPVTENSISVTFASDLPDSKFFTFTISENLDVEVGGRDCCIRDDVVQVYVDGCLWGSIDSGGGAWGTHTWEYFTYSLPAGLHTVEYRNVISSVGPSGWIVEDTPTSHPFSGTFACEQAIDIHPGSYPNPINIKSNGVVPVAILGSATFDVTTVDVTNLYFGPWLAPPAHDLGDPAVYTDHLQDVNTDGYTDLVVHFRQKVTGLTETDTSACIFASVIGGEAFGGCDSIKVP